MDDFSGTFFGVLAGLAGLVGLVLAANAVDDGIYIFGIVMMVFGVLFNALLVKLRYDQRYGS